jgi:hypothetical protein
MYTTSVPKTKRIKCTELREYTQSIKLITSLPIYLHTYHRFVTDIPEGRDVSRGKKFLAENYMCIMLIIPSNCS